MTPDQFARMLAGAEVIAGRAQLPFDQLPVEEQERHRLTARSLLDAVAQSAPADRAADVSSCPGRELDPNPCRCPCYGCKHHCSAHNPEEVPDSESAPAETALRDRIAAAIWERQNPGRRYADCEYRWKADAEADADAVLAALFGPIPAGTDVATWTAIRAIQLMNEAGQQRDDAKAALLRELIDEAVECDGHVTVQELRRMARKTAPTVSAEPPAAPPAVSSGGQAAHTTRDAEWRAAAVVVEAMNEGCGQAKPCASCDAREDAAAELRRMADETQPAEAEDGETVLLRLTVDAVEEGRRELRSDNARLRAQLWTLAAALDGLHTLIATSSRDWQTYRVDAWLWAVLCGWDCEQAEHDGTCTHGALEETAAMHGWDDDTVAKARRYRAAVRILTEPAGGARQPKEA